MTEAMELEIRREESVGILKVDGYINNTAGEQIAEACDRLLEEGANSFLFDLDGCRLVNSIGISILIEIFDKVEARNGKVAFCRVTPTVSKMFRIMGLLQMASIYDSQKEGLEQLRS